MTTLLVTCPRCELKFGVPPIFSCSRPWHVVGQDEPPDDNRRVEVTVLWPFGDRTREIWSYSKAIIDKWRNLYWRTEKALNVKVVAWCELGEPWRKVPGAVEKENEAPSGAGDD